MPGFTPCPPPPRCCAPPPEWRAPFAVAAPPLPPPWEELGCPVAGGLILPSASDAVASVPRPHPSDASALHCGAAAVSLAPLGSGFVQPAAAASEPEAAALRLPPRRGWPKLRVRPPPAPSDDASNAQLECRAAIPDAIFPPAPHPLKAKVRESAREGRIAAWRHLFKLKHGGLPSF